MKLWQWSLVLGGIVVLMMSLMSPEQGVLETAPTPGDAHDSPGLDAQGAVLPAAPSQQGGPGGPGGPKTPPLQAAPAPAAPTPEVAVNERPVAEPQTEKPAKPAMAILPTGGPVEVLKRAYQSSSADGSAAEAEAQIRSSLDNDNVEISLDSVTCHAKVCRIRTAWTPETSLSYMALAMLVGQDISTLIGVDALTDEKQPARADVDVYIARKGLTIDDLN